MISAKHKVRKKRLCGYSFDPYHGEKGRGGKGKQRPCPAGKGKHQQNNRKYEEGGRQAKGIGEVDQSVGFGVCSCATKLRSTGPRERGGKEPKGEH